MNANIHIVLISPQGDANIGAAARAMKNFGFYDLRLVNPAPYLTDDSFTWAVDGRDVLERARAYKTLAEALADATYTAAFTRRLGRSRRRHMTIAQAAPDMVLRSQKGGVALVFGCEDKGLSNEDVRRCDAVIEIPTSKELPSINLAQSVIIACYEIYKHLPHAKEEDGGALQENFLSRQELNTVLNQIDSMLSELGYYEAPDTDLRTRILDQFEKLFGRAGLTRRDVGMFEGLISRIKKMTVRCP